VLVAPLVIGQKLIGILNIYSKDKPRLFGEKERELAKVFANQAAIAIDNARLYEEVTERSSALAALYEAGRAVTSSRALDEILRQIAERAYRLASRQARPARLSLIALVEGHKVRFAETYPPEHLPRLLRQIGDIDLEQGDRIGVTGRAVKTQRSQLVADVARDADYIEYDPAVLSELAVPIVYEDQVLGVIKAGHAERDAFGERDVSTLESLATQAAQAIRHARRSELQQAVYEASKAIATEIDIRQRGLLMPILEQAVTRIRWPHRPKAIIGLIQLYDQPAGELYLESVYPPEEHPELVARLGERHFLDREKNPEGRAGIQARAILEKGIQRVADVRTDPDYLEACPGSLSELDAPLRVGDEIVGVLGLESDRLGAFDEIDGAALQSLADLAGIVIQTARQYEDLRQTKGLVGARTALAWMGMANSTWRHSIEGCAVNIRNAITLLRAEMADESVSPAVQQLIAGTLELIDQQGKMILDKPITPPLSSEEGIDVIAIDDLIRERTSQLWENEKYRPVDLRLTLSPDADVAVRVSPDWFRRALDLLIDNAVESMADTPQRQLEVTTVLAGEQVEIAIADKGTGIAPDVYPKLFRERIASPGSKGLGMGLLMVQAILQTYGGDVRIGATGPDGTTMVISLPIADQDAVHVR
jgi:GAF domain-containing protein